MTQDAYRGSNTDPRSMHRYAYVLNNPATFVDAWGYLPEYKPQPQRTFFDMVGDRLGGAWSGVTGMVGGMIEAVKADPWRALAVGALVVGVGVIFPAAVPAMISMGQTMATNYLVGQATTLAVGAVKDFATSINPALGTLMSGLEVVSNLYNAGTSLMSGVGALGGLDIGNLSSLLSFDTSNALSAVTGNLSTITNTFGVDIPGLNEANQALRYMGMAGQFGGHYNEAHASMFASNPGLGGFEYGGDTRYAPPKPRVRSQESLDMEAGFAAIQNGTYQNAARDNGVQVASAGSVLNWSKGVLKHVTNRHLRRDTEINAPKFPEGTDLKALADEVRAKGTYSPGSNNHHHYDADTSVGRVRLVLRPDGNSVKTFFPLLGSGLITFGGSIIDFLNPIHAGEAY